MTRPTYETLLALAEAVDIWLHCQPKLTPSANTLDALAAYRAELRPPLRTREDVDAEIATVIRVAYGSGHVEVFSGGVNFRSRIDGLCAEPTRKPEAVEKEADEECFGCGLSQSKEPTVLQDPDNKYRCADCHLKWTGRM